jgi:hypothetical protein
MNGVMMAIIAALKTLAPMVLDDRRGTIYYCDRVLPVKPKYYTLVELLNLPDAHV